jgi:hypothetical protein
MIATLLALSLLPAEFLADEGSPKAFAEQGEAPEEEAVYAYLCLDKKLAQPSWHGILLSGKS